LVQAFLKKWWVESDFKAPNLPLSIHILMSSYLYRDSRIHLAYKKSLEIPKGLSEAVTRKIANTMATGKGKTEKQ
jgi:hypothetical protein